MADYGHFSGVLLLENTLTGSLSEDAYNVNGKLSVLDDYIFRVDFSNVPTGEIVLHGGGVYDVTDYAMAKVDDGRWIRPADCPDLESIELPGSDDTDTYYILYDRSLGCDGVDIRGLHKFTSIYKGTVIDGEFVGDLVASNIQIFQDTLNEKYTVYKIVGGDGLLFGHWTTGSYPFTYQGVLWVYAEAPMSTDIGGSSTNSAAFGLYTRKYKVTRVQHLLRMTLPGRLNGYRPLMDFYVGYEENGDFNGITLTRTGHGCIFHQNPLDDEPVIIKNVTINSNTQNMFSSMSNVEFDNCTFAYLTYAFRDSPIKRIVFHDNCHVTCLNASYLCSCAYSLEYCDFSPVPMSSAT